MLKNYKGFKYSECLPAVLNLFISEMLNFNASLKHVWLIATVLCRMIQSQNRFIAIVIKNIKTAENLQNSQRQTQRHYSSKL